MGDSDLKTGVASLEESVTNELTQAAQNGSLGKKLGGISGGASIISSELSIGLLSGVSSSGPCQAFHNDPAPDTRYYPELLETVACARTTGFRLRTLSHSTILLKNVA